MKRKTYQFLISYIISSLITLGVILFNIKENALPFQEYWSKLLSDGFFVSAAVFGGVWALTWISHEGAFDIFSYSFKRFGARMFRKNPKYTNVPKTFYEYRVLKSEEEPAYIGYLGIVALTDLILAIVFVVLAINYIGVPPKA